MNLSELQKSLIWYRDLEITFLAWDKEYSLEYTDSTKIEWKITFWLKWN
jgi:hypothetical protein